MISALFALQHADTPQLDLVYFWAAVLLAATPVVILGTIGALVVRGVVHARRAAREAALGAAGHGPTPG
ncbi:MAG TPA: hypothetical protein VH158_10295 [Gemmatimonadales bacterium]|jgi:hypothetical protein|nr:hypothetical protein [Gemmatimonadales bacterium]